MTSYFNDDQLAQLLGGINPNRVSHDRRGNSHVEAYEIRAHLCRVFGFGRWSQRVLAMEPIFEEIKEDKVTCAYRAQVELTVCAPDGTLLATYTEWATGDAQNFPIASRGDAHDFAVKTAESQALKRAAVNMGDAFGLGLYRKGSTAALVRQTLVTPTKDGATTAQPVDSHITEQLPPESTEAEPQPDPRETNRPTPPPPPAAPPAAPAAAGPPADEPPAPAESDTQRRQTEAQRIRKLAMEEPPAELAQPGRWHAHLMGEAMKGQVLNEKVESLTSTNPVTLKRFLEERMKQYVGEQRHHQANDVAS